MKDKGNKAVSRVRKPSLFARVVALIEEARQKVATVANLAQVYTNFEIGRQIVEEEQGGKRRAEYGSKILIDLSQKLTARFGRGWSVDNLENEFVNGVSISALLNKLIFQFHKAM